MTVAISRYDCETQTRQICSEGWGTPGGSARWTAAPQRTFQGGSRRPPTTSNTGPQLHSRGSRGPHAPRLLSTHRTEATASSPHALQTPCWRGEGAGAWCTEAGTHEGAAAVANGSFPTSHSPPTTPQPHLRVLAQESRSQRALGTLLAAAQCPWREGGLSARPTGTWTITGRTSQENLAPAQVGPGDMSRQASRGAHFHALLLRLGPPLPSRCHPPLRLPPAPPPLTSG